MDTPLSPAIDELREIASRGEESEFVLHVVYMRGEKSSVAEGTLPTEHDCAANGCVLVGEQARAPDPSGGSIQGR